MGTNLIISVTLLTIIEALGVGPTLWIYAAFNVAAFIFVLKLMPDLTGRSLEQIEDALQRGRFRPGDLPARRDDEGGRGGDEHEPRAADDGARFAKDGERAARDEVATQPRR